VDARRRLVWLLADPWIAERDYQNLKAWLLAGGLVECLNSVDKLRALERASTAVRREKGRKRVETDSDPIVQEVDRLLRIESGMTARNALTTLADWTGYQAELPERVSFAEGVKRISREIGESRVLTAASQIRNERVHGTGSSAWPLKRE
jgi:hypothetical protein